MQKNSFNYVSVVVTYNRKKLLIESIDSLLHQTILPKQVIIIDNHSTDGTRQLLNDSGVLQNPLVSYYLMKENVGGSGGFYEGLKHAVGQHADWVSVSDDDAIFTKDYFERICEANKKNSDIGAFTGTVKLEDGRIQVSHRRIITNWSILREKRVPLKEYKDNFEIDIASFVGLVIKGDVLKSIGLPRKDFFIWYDDIEYSLRIRKITKILNVSQAIITHKTKIASNDFQRVYIPDWREYYGIRNRLVTILEHSSSKSLARIYVLYSFLKLVLSTLSSRYKGQRKHYFFVVVRSYKDAIFKKMGENDRYVP